MLTAEAVVSVCGVARALADKPKPPTEAELKRAEKIGEEIAKRAHEVIAMAKQGTQVGPPEAPDYRDTHKRLTDKIDGDGLAQLLASLPPDVQPNCATVWSRAVLYLDGVVPKRVEDGITGPKLLDPSRGDIAEFAWAWRIANTHLVAFDLMADGMLVGPEVNHFKTMFPTIHATACAELLDAIAERVAKDKEWTTPWWLQKQLCTLIGVSPVSKSLLADIEGAIQTSKKQAQQRTNDIKISAQLATPAQRLEAK